MGGVPIPTLPMDVYDYGYATGVAIWVIIVAVIISVGAAVGLAFIPATIARKKGYSYGGFWAFGFFLFIPALIVALVIQDKTQPPYPPYPPYPPPGQPYGQQPPYGQPYAQPAGNCLSCGAPVSGSDAFCPTCGARVK